MKYCACMDKVTSTPINLWGMGDHMIALKVKVGGGGHPLNDQQLIPQINPLLLLIPRYFAIITHPLPLHTRTCTCVYVYMYM